MSKRQPYLKNPRIHLLLVLMTLGLIFIPAMNKTPDEETSIKATDAAVKFLYLVDNGEYGQSWEVASTHLQETIGKQEWEEKLEAIRGAIGTVAERVKDDVTYLEAAGDMPEGEYVVILFNTNFSEREFVVENVTLHLATDGAWRVGGYFLK
jgi:hypothetical protein